MNCANASGKIIALAAAPALDALVSVMAALPGPRARRATVGALHLALNDAGRLAPQNHSPPQCGLIARRQGYLHCGHLRHHRVIDVAVDVLVTGAIGAAS